jgi:DUF4097 and DUF4098 domain-containing protein YvlB
MRIFMRKALVLAIVSLFGVWGCDLSINRDLHIPDGKRCSEGAHSINGTISIGKGCDIRGASRTINGAIEIGEGSHVRSLQSINGTIDVAPLVQIRGDVQTINGRVTCATGAVVQGDIETINGRVRLDSTHVTGYIKTFNGNLELDHHSKVQKDIIIKGDKSKKHSHRQHPLDIRLSNGSQVLGDILVKDPDRVVTVYLSQGSQVQGRVENAKIVNEE